MRTSTRLPPHTGTNQLARALAALQAAGETFADLTQSNPTLVGIQYPPDLLSPMADPAALQYEPRPLGVEETRRAIAADCARREATVELDDIVLVSSTSEAYTWLFKLLCDPGDAVLVPRPSYPLFEHLTRLEGVRVEPYDLDYHGRWEVDMASLDASAQVRAVLVVSPNNPTGSYISGGEFERMSAFCRSRGCPLIVDEVFADYPLDARNPLTDLASRAKVLTFTLAGFSKSLGLPQLKLGWIAIGGPVEERRAALRGLELIADSFLSVGTPVQIAAPTLLLRAAQVREAIHERVAGNLESLRRLASAFSACEVLRTEGGWSAVVRIPATRSEEQFVLDLLQAERVLVHPGYFFDFRSEAFVVVSLLPPKALFADACERLLRMACD